MSAVASNTWSTIPETPEFTERLLSLVHSREELEKAGYLMEPLASEQMKYMKRCANCRRKMYKGAQRPRRDSLKKSTLTLGQEKPVPGIGLDKSALSEDYDVRSLLKEVEPAQEIPKPRQNKEQEPVCRYHPSEAVYKPMVVKNVHRYCLVYPCCGSRDLYSKGCVSSAKHTPLEYPPGVLEKAWEFLPTPAASNRRTAVALDCEMGVNTMGESELIRISMVDFFTGQTLIDSLVRPKDVIIKDYNTRYSGVSKQDMNDAIAKGRFLDGKAAAREEIWKFVNPDTIVIGHGACADLKDLRWIHGNIVDSFNVVGPGIRKRNLKSLTMDLLGKSVQNKRGHDSLEDALASRELVIWWVGQISTPRDEIKLLLD